MLFGHGMKKVLLVLFLLVAGGFFAFSLAFPSYGYRLRMTLHADVDGQERSGSSVIQVTWRAQPMVGDASPATMSVRGEAAMADLGSHGVLLLTLREAGYFAAHAFLPGRPCVFGIRNDVAITLSRLRGTAPADRTCPPFVVWMPDRSDPQSERGVPTNDLPVTIAPGVRLTKITFAMTGDPLTTDLGNKLPWLGSYVDTDAERTSSGPYRLPASYLTQGM